MDEPSVLFIALIQGCRMLAIIAGFLVLYDSIKILLGFDRIKHRPKANATSWLIIALCAATGGFGLIISQDPYITLYDSLSDLYVILWIWITISAGLLLRASSRVYRPTFIWLAAAFFLITSTTMQYLHLTGSI